MTKQTKVITVLVVLVFGMAIILALQKNMRSGAKITNFEECVAAGNSIVDSAPRQCSTADGKRFTEKASAPVAGNDADEHGCIGSAEYSWCAQKNKCLRTWEEKCEEDVPQEGQLVGNDADEHGCIGSAGYSWCAPKNKCLRVWEEECYKSVSEEIQYFLAKKYNKVARDVKIIISQQEGDFARGSVKFDDSKEGGIFLARKTGNMWEVVFDGNGMFDCKKMREEYKFPDSILKPGLCD